jgi:hypothetical protein
MNLTYGNKIRDYVYIYSRSRGNAVREPELEEYVNSVEYELTNKEIADMCKLFSEGRGEHIWWERGEHLPPLYENAECFCLNDRE